jgi:hypothetical protein
VVTFKSTGFPERNTLSERKTPLTAFTLEKSALTQEKPGTSVKTVFSYHFL